MRRTPGWVRGGVFSRAGGFLIDYLLVMLLTQGVAALLYGPTGGLVQDSSAFLKECRAATTRPAALSVPLGFEPTAEAVCTFSFLSWPAARSHDLVRQQPGSAIKHNVGYLIDASGDVVVALDLAALHWPLLALMRWAIERRGGRSPGRRLAKLSVVGRLNETGRADFQRKLARRYLVFAAPAVPSAIIVVLLAAAASIGFAPAADLVTLLGALGGLLPSVALVAAAIAIIGQRDTFYDEVAGTSVVRSFDARHDAAPQDILESTPADVRKESAGSSGTAVPWGTLALCLMLCAIFAAEIIANRGATAASNISWFTVMWWGGLSYEAAIQAGQWYRLFSASFLHWSPVHLGANLVGLLAIGALLEPVVGAAWFVAIFLFGGLGGAVASIIHNDPTLLSAGASGAIMALFAAGLMISFRLPDDWRRLALRAFCLVSLATMLWKASWLPIAMADHAMHLGGAAAGGILGLAYATLYRRGRTTAAGRLALGAAITISAATFASVPMAGFGDFSLTRLQIPAAELPKTDAEWIARASELVRRFPRDPRSQTARAVTAGDDVAIREAALASITRIMTAEPPAAAGAVYQNALMLVAQERTAAYDFAAAKALLMRAMSAGLPAKPELLVLRADVEHALGELDDAKADYELLLKSRPDNVAALVGLGHVLSDLGDQRAAIVRADQAIAIDQRHFAAWRQRGWFLFLDGRFSEAVSDLERAYALNSADHYVAMWLHLASMRAGQGERLGAMARTLDMGQWPAPAIRYLSQEIDSDTLRSAATARNRIKNQGQGCEAHFYIAENHLLRDDLPEAARHLLAAQAMCPKRFYEWGGARAEFKKIEQ